MRIIYILKSFAQLAGTERVVADKINYLARKGYNITLITYEQGKHPLAYDLHQSIQHIDLDTRFFTLYSHSLLLRYFYYIILKKSFRKKLSEIIHQQKPDYIITTTYSLKVLEDIIKVKGCAKIIMESHISHDSIIRHYDFKLNNINRYIFQIYDYKNQQTIKKIDIFITLTEKDASQWKKLGIKVNVIPNPVTDYPDSIDTNKPCHHRIISVGRLNHQKGFDKLIKAFSLISDKHPKWKIDIFGQGELESELNNLIINNNLQGRIKIHNPTKNIYKEYLRSDFYVLSSKFEGFGLVLVEAMSCGIPVISFDCAHGPNEIITDGYDGFLVENGNINILAKKMDWLIEHRSERQKMGAQARISAKKYDIQQIMNTWEELFKNHLK